MNIYIRFFLFFFLFFFLLKLTNFAYAVPATIDNPVDVENLSGWNFNQYGCIGEYWTHCKGAGIDGADDTLAWDINLNKPSFDYDVGQAVYAIEDGYIYTGGEWSGGSVGQLLINHNRSNDLWSSAYLHMNNITNRKQECLQKGGGSCLIHKGEIIGNISNKGATNNHLHFVVYSGQNGSGSSVNVTRTNVTAKRRPYFDGSGSLVDPSGNCEAGCKEDYIQLHHHEKQPSAGSFQVLRMAGVCESITLSGLKYAKAEVRSWSKGGADSDFYDLKRFPVTIPLKPDRWNIVAFKTTSPVPLGESRLVKATCNTSFIISSDAKKISEGEVPMDFDNEFFFGGAGSLVSLSGNYSNDDTVSGFGRSRDTVITLNGRKTLSIFQALKSTLCQKIAFKSPVPFELSWKPWNGSTWLDSRNMSNGDKFDLPSYDYGGNGWWLLKVKVSSTTKGTIDAVCEP